MSDRHAALLIAAFLAGVGVFADYLLKLASSQPHSVQSRWFWSGLLVYAAMAGGWVYVMRHLSFAEIGVVYSVATVLLLTLVGTLVLGEPLRSHEVLGAGMAIGSLFLLARFA
jgi:undecaprenyl phosphate-alpha-L-ara4N flippase subunit ArnF